jgi:hypothetical protein
MIMRKYLRRGAVLTALAGACTIAVAPAALAAPTTSPEAYALGASGLVSLANTPDQTTVGTSSVASATLTGLLSATGLSATVTSQDSTSAEVAGLNTTGLTSILGTVSADVVKSTCTANSNGTFTGTADIANLSILGATFNGSATANTNLLVSAPAGVASIAVTLNKQEAGPVAGSETVIAIEIMYTLTVGGTETIDVASSTCGPFVAGVPLTSGPGLAIGLGAIGLVGLGLGTFYVRRHRQPLAAA